MKHRPGASLHALDWRQIHAPSGSTRTDMEGRSYRRRWDESRGDEFDASGQSVLYFEVDNDGWPVRQVEVYDTGRVLRYGPGHEEDQYGGLGQVSLDDPEEDWSSFVIARDAYERVWDSAGG